MTAAGEAGLRTDDDGAGGAINSCPAPVPSPLVAFTCDVSRGPPLAEDVVLQRKRAQIIGLSHKKSMGWFMNVMGTGQVLDVMR